ncbi:chemotaxis-specific protein-glutamate methyltransferase CheB [Marinospirillum insulare]|uniref:Protein-glutamate methylesterase/protein-glutamine glutaminase n=1 Tax=Marinospirillum insulare TaxID=217169 RepID=A0ABQ6A1L1_9GAMM|nr:chemotaxis-specific protein-glutamate methyltransferase CheB [Marinospirillum insulare]GLR65187.1 chemotaxis response regulator protein-glutamate methylesterase [Marinospirillum insulare]
MTSTKVIRVLIVDDSSVARSILCEILKDQDDIEVIAEATNGQEALELVEQLSPDLVTMDLNMPVMSGLEAIEHIMHRKAVPILVVSSEGDADLAYQALSNGALEVMAKPNLDPEKIAEFIHQIRLLSGVPVITRMKRFNPNEVFNLNRDQVKSVEAKKNEYPIFAIASSTGGPKALAHLLAVLPENFPAPILVAQHISHGFIEGMAYWLSTLSLLPVKVAEEGEKLMPGKVYLSPSEQHLTVTKTHQVKLQARDEKDIYHPSCDVMLSSVAEVFGSEAVGIIMTGMGRDGTKGMTAIYEQGGVTLAQDEASSVIYGMNAEAVNAGVIHRELPLTSLAEEMLRILLLKSTGYLAALRRGEL